MKNCTKTSAKIFNLAAYAVLSAIFLSCSRVEELPETSDFMVKAECPQTRTYLSEGNHKWVTGDLVRVLSDNGTSVKSSVCDASADVFDFSVSGWPAAETPLYAVYCGHHGRWSHPAD